MIITLITLITIIFIVIIIIIIIIPIPIIFIITTTTTIIIIMIDTVVSVTYTPASPLQTDPRRLAWLYLQREALQTVLYSFLHDINTFLGVMKRCVCVCIYIYINICTFIHIYIYIHIVAEQVTQFAVWDAHQAIARGSPHNNGHAGGTEEGGMSGPYIYIYIYVCVCVPKYIRPNWHSSLGRVQASATQTSHLRPTTAGHL